MRLHCSGGVNFAELSEEQAYQFQKDLLSVMLHMEQTYFNLAASEAKKGRKTVVLCDRGAMDASACMSVIDRLMMMAQISIAKLGCASCRN